MNNQVKVDFIGSYGFRTQLLNGNITVPDQFGGYIVSTGCGSGKTRAIKEIIRQRYNDGILYCVDTKDECSEMEKYILEELVPDPSNNILRDDVMCIHWDNEEEMYKYINHPSQIMYKKILIITHTRFFKDLINYFLIYNPSSPVGVFDGDFYSLMNRIDLRKYIFFDETPQFIKPFNEIYKEAIQGYDLFIEKIGFYDFKEYFDRTFKGTRGDYPNNTPLEQIKRESTLLCIPKFEDFLKNQTRNKSDKYNLYFFPKDLLQYGMKTMVVIFEGAGDILFSTTLDRNRCFKLIDVKNKYNSPVIFKKFNHSFKKTTITQCDLSSNNYQNYLDDLCSKIISHNKVLIVTWKYIGSKNKPLIDKYDDYLRYELSQRIPYESGRYEVTHFGASNTKSTNKFMDYDAIILCSDWNPYKVGKGHIEDGDDRDQVEKISQAYLMDIDENMFKKWYFIQLISRIGLRKHDGNIYTVYYANIDDKFINELDRYFNANISFTYPDPNRLKETVRDILVNKGMRNQTIEKVLVLCEYDPNISAAIIDGNVRYTLTITLDKIHELLSGLYKNPEKKAKTYQRTVGNGLFEHTNTKVTLNII